MDEIEMGTEIYLEPEVEKIKNAKEIAVESQTAEKYIFCISYEATEKSVVLSEIKNLECEILEQSDTKTCVTVKASMAQLAAIKSLNCIEKVEIADDYSATTTENVSEIMTANELEATEFTEHVSLAAMEEEGISTMCYGGDSGSDCDNSNTMQTAYYLPLSSWVNGCICCPGTEIWYRFTASASNAAEYTIYTSGSLDTMGYLYSSNGTLITSNDDGGGSLNFSITEELTYGATYYVKVKAYGSNTGNYDIRVGYTTQSSSGGQDDSDCSNDQASAIQLTLNSWQSDEICCPGAEMWYKFTPSTTAYYTVYTVGSLDTVGHIYDADCNQIDSDDDAGTGLNFMMVAHLTAGQTYYVKVAAYGSNTGYFSIAVTSTVFVEYVSIDQSYVALDKGETVTLTATVTPSYATNKTLRWETGDASVATVNQDGVVTARGAGTTCICAYSQDGSNKSSCCEVSVNVPVESVTINTSSRLMRVGEYDYLYAEVCPTDAVNKLIRWSSTNTGVVWVNEATGRIEARGIGSATIYATAQDGTGVRGGCAVQVEAPIAVQGIDICCSNYTMNVGESTYLSYDIYPSDATNKGVTWCSSNTSVAEVNASTGRITAKSAGTTNITVTTNDGSYVDYVWLSVNSTKIYQTEKTFRYNSDGTLPEDLEYNDISVADLKAMDWINWSDFVATTPTSFRTSWQDMCTSLFSTEPLQTVILDMIEHFMGGTATDYSNETLTEKALEHNSTQTYISSVKDCINHLLNQYNGDIMALEYFAATRESNPLVQLMQSEGIYQPVYNTANDKITGLTICVDGLWGNQIEVKSYNKTGNAYSGVLSFTLYDHFGLDAADVEKYGLLAGFRSWYILQHNKEYNGAYKPFVTVMNFDVPFSGVIS
ncbi:MAG: DUF3289 family protein [Ruminococcaceae bacterium]|nr:DUF3289 family protein [Oscillospiraceae bacterium]